MVVLVAAAALVPLSPTSGPTAAASQAPAKPYLNTTPFYGHGDLAFVSLGDLYVLDGASRHVVNVTGADVAASDPEFSPNGKWLTYETDQGETSWLARADGLGSKRLAGTASWLPNGQLALGGPTSTSTSTVGNNEALLPTGGSTQTRAVKAGSSVIYLFVTNTLQVHPPRSSQGVERVETAASPNGRRRSGTRPRSRSARQEVWRGPSSATSRSSRTARPAAHDLSLLL